VVFGLGFLAAVLGDNLGYLIGRKLGRAAVLRYGRYVLLTAARLDKAEAFFARHGGKVVTVARFVSGLRQANGIIAGLTRMRWLRFLAFNALGAALWVGAWCAAGYLAGSQIQTLYDTTTRYGLYALAVVLIVGAALLVRNLTAAANLLRAQPKPGCCCTPWPCGRQVLGAVKQSAVRAARGCPPRRPCCPAGKP